MVSHLQITAQHKDKAEEEIRDKTKRFDYNTLEYPIEVIVQKYLDDIDTDENELFIPDDRREMVWDEHKQSKFIESVMFGLPIPYMFVADTSEEKDLARLEIIDGTQRIRTLKRFVTNELTLQKLEELESLNGFTFKDLPLPRQRRFKRTTMRMIVLNAADEKVRRGLFERINSGSLEQYFGQFFGFQTTIIQGLQPTGLIFYKARSPAKLVKNTTLLKRLRCKPYSYVSKSVRSIA